VSRREILCTTCISADIEEIVSFGIQPLSTGFFHGISGKPITISHELSLGFCRSCSTIQLVKRFPIRVLARKNPKIAFREPQKHLPDLVEIIKKLPGISLDSGILGLSYIDRDLLNLIGAIGYKNIHYVDLSRWKFWNEHVGLEVLQSILSSQKWLQRISLSLGKIDLVSARFILEHAESAIGFLKSLGSIVRPGGYILLEVPNCQKILNLENHALIWEDHFTYFTPDTLSDLVGRLGWQVVNFVEYSYDYENALVAIVKVPEFEALPTSNETKKMPHQLQLSLQKFNSGYEKKKSVLRQQFTLLKMNGEKLAVFGAGHHAAKFLNFYDIHDLFEFVVDDNPIKDGMYMPGSALRIRKASALEESGISICVSMLGPEVEAKVRFSMPSFFKNGGQFISAFNI